MLPPGSVSYYMTIDDEIIVDETKIQVDKMNLIDNIKRNK